MKNIKIIFKPIMKFVIKHNLVVFIVFIVTGLSFSIYYLNNSLSASFETHTSDTSAQVNLVDFTKYQKVNSLVSNIYTADNMPEATLPTGRQNPFAE